jgi:hypothetical protein
VKAADASEDLRWQAIATTQPLEDSLRRSDQSSSHRLAGRKFVHRGKHATEMPTKVYSRAEPVSEGVGGRPLGAKHFALKRAEIEGMYSGLLYDEFRNNPKAYGPSSGRFTNTFYITVFRLATVGAVLWGRAFCVMKGKRAVIDRP